MQCLFYVVVLCYVTTLLAFTLALRGRVSKYVTNGIRTAVMDAIGFLCVSLVSSTVQLHDSVGSRRACACSEAGFSSQNSDLMRGAYYWQTAFCCAVSCGQKDSMQKIFIKKCFLFTVFLQDLHFSAKHRSVQCKALQQSTQQYRGASDYDTPTYEFTNLRLH
jgi:hypothetical protein